MFLSVKSWEMVRYTVSSVVHSYQLKKIFLLNLRFLDFIIAKTYNQNGYYLVLFITLVCSIKTNKKYVYASKLANHS